jgi:hypothetical protein
MDITDYFSTPTGRLSFVCPECGEPVADELRLPSADFGADKPSDMTTLEDFDIACGSCQAQFVINLVAMPWDVQGTVEDNPEVAVSIEEYPPDPDEDWIQDPRSIFESSLVTIRAHIFDYEPKYQNVLSFHHMLFMQLFSAFEAYLADQLITIALEDDEARARLLSQAPGLSDIKVRLIEVEKTPNIVLANIKQFFRLISYHDLKKVGPIYDIAYGHKFFDKMPVSTKTILSEAVSKRHDCVHRNGRDQDGNLHTEIESNYVLRVAEAMQEAVDFIYRNSPEARGINDQLPF